MRRLLGLTVSCSFLLLALLAPAAAWAQATTWAVEGPISAINPATRTITANGVSFVVPAALVVEGTRGTVTGASLNLLLDAAAPNRARSIFAGVSANGTPYSGGTVIADGTIAVDANGVRTFTAANVFIELAENNVIGNLDSINVAAGTAVVNGVPVKLNTDERFAADIVGAGGVPLTFAQLAGAVNTLVTVGGYFFDGTMYSTLLETDILPPGNGTDSVAITRAQGRNVAGNRSEINVVGSVAPFSAGGVLTIRGLINGTLVNLGTAQQVQDPEIPTQGTYTFRRRNLATAPTRVRVESQFGGVAEAPVVIR